MKSNRYIQIIEIIFGRRWRKGAETVSFAREELEQVAREQQIKLPKNLGDLVYTFRYRNSLPDSITATAKKGHEWIIRAAGRGLYRFDLVPLLDLTPKQGCEAIKVPDATPGLIARYALSDEQALLARLRYNRLVDVFLGLTCYSLQNHLRTTVPDMGQIETDELYVGLDRTGSHYVIPVQAKGGKDRMNRVQIEQDFSLCAARFSNLVCRPVGAQFIGADRIALLEFTQTDGLIAIRQERHYQLVEPDALTTEDLARYRQTIAT